MQLLILIVCCIGVSRGDSQAEATEITSNKLTSIKSSLNLIPNTPIQKTTTLIQQPQYVPQYVIQKPVQQQPTMYIIAQQQNQVQHSPMFQQAVQQLLNYYHNNPQARLQLLQQQSGLPPQTVYHHQPHQMPSGALHVIPSPQLEQNSAATSDNNNNQPPQQAVYAIPAQSHQFGLSSNILAQLQAQPQQPQFILQQPIVPQTQQYTFSPQFAQTYQPQTQAQPQFHANLNFGLKPNVASSIFSANDFSTQTASSGSGDKSQSSSSNYTPIYRAAYIKG